MILIICGPPGSGKSTIVNRLHERLRDRGEDVRILHSDDFSRNTYRQMYDRVAEDPQADWILDGTFYKEKWREWFRRFAGQTPVKVIHVTAALETCLERNRRRDGIEADAVHIIYREFDTPWADLTLDTDELAPEEAVDRILAKLGAWRED